MAIKKVEGTTTGATATPSWAAKPKVELPTTRSVPPANIGDYTYYIYGQQKIGKTSFTTSFPDCLHFMFEPGGRPYKIFQLTPDELKSWLHTVAYIDKLESLKAVGELPYKTIAVDTVDLMWQQCQNHYCQLLGISHPNDAGDFGKTYNNIEQAFRNEIVRLSSLGCGVIFLTHEVDKEVETRSGHKYQQIVPSAQKKCNLILGKFCDLTGNYFVSDKGERKLLIRPNSDAEAGNRIEGHFLYLDGSDMKEIPMGTSAKEAYANFVISFNNGFAKEVPTPDAVSAAPSSVVKKPMTITIKRT